MILKYTLPILAFAVVVSPSRAIPHQKYAKYSSQQSQNGKQTPTPSTAPTERNASQGSKNIQANGVDTNNNPKAVRLVSIPPVTVTRRWTDNLALWASAVLALVGIAGVIVALITLCSIRDQITHTARAAKAAEDSVKAFIDSEKAWLKAEKYRIELPAPTDSTKPYPTYYVPVPIKNFGKTVAHVFDAYATSGIYSPLPDVPRCPTHPAYKTVIVPGESWNLPAPVPARAVDSIREGTERRPLYIYGFVKYRDIGNDPRECWFCYFYQFRDPRDPTMPEGFYVCGNAPDAYTKCT